MRNFSKLWEKKFKMLYKYSTKIVKNINKRLLCFYFLKSSCTYIDIHFDTTKRLFTLLIVFAIIKKEEIAKSVDKPIPNIHLFKSVHN